MKSFKKVRRTDAAKLLIGIVKLGPDTVAVSGADKSVIVSVGEPALMFGPEGHELIGRISLFNDFSILGLEIETADGVYATDIAGSGVHELKLVEDADGCVINI